MSWYKAEVERSEPIDFVAIGALELGPRVVIGAAPMLDSRLEGMSRGAVALRLELSLRPGKWQLLVAGPPRRALQENELEVEAQVLVLCHEDELELEEALAHTEPAGVVAVPESWLCLMDADAVPDSEDLGAFSQMIERLPPLAGPARIPDPDGRLVGLACPLAGPQSPRLQIAGASAEPWSVLIWSLHA